MGSFGERLRREREMRGITIDEIAAATKIGSRSLKALEDEEFNKLPGGIFNKGFVRAYAKFLGINEEQAVADYLAASGEPEEAPNINTAQILAQRQDVEAQAKAASKRGKELQTIQTDGTSGFPWGAVVALVLILVLAWGGRVGYYKYKVHQEAKIQAKREAEVKAQADAQRLEQERQQAALSAQQATAAAQTTAPDSQNSATPATGINPPAEAAPIPKAEIEPVQPEKPSTADKKKAEGVAPAMAPGSFVVSIRATEASWIQVTADGKRLMSGTLTASSKRDFQAHDKMTLIIGNPPGTELAFNGKSMTLPPLPADKKTQNVTISADGKLQVMQ